MRAYLYRFRARRVNLFLTFSGRTKWVWRKHICLYCTYNCKWKRFSRLLISPSWHSLNVFYYCFFSWNKTFISMQRLKLNWGKKCWNQADFLRRFFPLQRQRQTMGFYFLSVRTRWTSFFCWGRKGLPGEAQWPGDERDNNNPRDKEEK